MKPAIITISLVTAVAFLLMAIVATYQIFTMLITSETLVRTELWIFLILCFTGGVIMLSMAWGISELGQNRATPTLDDEDV